MIFDDELIAKREKLISEGIDPYPYSYPLPTAISWIRKHHTDFEREPTHAAGRIVAYRSMGKAIFLDIEDFDSRIQVYIKKDMVSDKEWLSARNLDLGDILGVKGTTFITRTGELTILAQQLELLAKTLIRVPISKEKDGKRWYQLTDVETRYRERYLEWITDRDARQRVLLRAAVMKALRRSMESRGFIEVDTPVIELIYGGAEARPFTTTIHDLEDQLAYLRISPELYLKRYIVGGFEKVYTICKNFRNESIDRCHNAEFTMMEWYQAYTDYYDQLTLFEQVVAEIVENITGGLKITYQGVELDFTTPWRRVSMSQLVSEAAGFEVMEAPLQKIAQFMRQHDIPIPEDMTPGIAMAEIYDALCEKEILQPTFVMDHPREISPLTKQKRGNPLLVERFEPVICGMEMGNAYSELTDPLVQYERFKEQRLYAHAKMDDGKVEHHPIDMDFIKAMSCGMPPTGGVGLGVDRLIMLLCDVPSIRDIIPFPLMKPLE